MAEYKPPEGTVAEVWQRILRSKDAERKRLAALPYDEKLRISFGITEKLLAGVELPQGKK